MAKTRTQRRTDRTIEEAQAAAQELHEEELKLSSEWLTLNAQLPELEARAGARALDARLAGDSLAPADAREVTRRQTELALLGGAIDEARRRRIQAAETVMETEYAAEVGTLRGEADKLRAEADERQKRTDKLLQELRDFEECDWSPKQEQPPPRPIGDQHGGAITINYIIVPRTELIRDEAAKLERQAAAVVEHEMTTSGDLEAHTPEELLDQVRNLDPVSWLGPRLDQATVWAEREAAEQQARLAQVEATRPEVAQHAAEAGMLLELTWRDGAIDEKQSRATIPYLDE